MNRRPACWAVAAGLVADRLLGEPPAAWHPVARFGQAMTWLERRWYADRRAAGVAYAAAGALGAGAAGLAAERAATLLIGRDRRRAAGAAGLAAAPATYLSVAGRALGTAASDVARSLHASDAESARRRLPALVGRDPQGLDEAEIARAAVESVAENTVDAVVAPAFWAGVGGAPAVLVYRAVNTLDAMVGHRSPRYHRFGWAAARADDCLNWVPARVTAVLVAVVRPRAAGDVRRAVRYQAGAHPSPNAGVAEAAFAAALQVRLGGVNRYGDRLERRPDLGTGRPPVAADIERAVELSERVTAAVAGLLMAASVARTVRSRWGAP